MKNRIEKPTITYILVVNTKYNLRVYTNFEVN